MSSGLGGSEETQRLAHPAAAAEVGHSGGVSVPESGQTPRVGTALHRPDGSPARVLVVDDEPSLSELLARVLRYEGWQVETAATGAAAISTARSFRPDAVVLDVILPDIDGVTVLGALRADNPQICVVFLTARDSVEDRIAGITAGGDDYVTKPFSLEEVLARLRGVLRRAGMARDTTSSVLAVGDLVVDEDAREVTRAGDRIELTVTEFELLRYLMHNPRRVLSKAQILDRVWEYDFGGQAHVVELYISYLRKKIDEGREPMIHTVRGAGYVLRAAP
jgi:two-component system OmpR family response regulator